MVRAQTAQRVALPPRVVVAGTASGVGKTTVTVGLLRALSKRGVKVQPFKVGPDYIDPSYHRVASSRPGRNLDPVLCGEELIAPLLAHGSAGAELALIEGVMGLFDGAAGRGELGSTAQVAKLLGAPVLLVLDGQALARSAAAVLYGFANFDPNLTVRGVIFNKVGSSRHRELLEEACASCGVPVVGALPRQDEVRAPERHLGLVPAGELGGEAERVVAAAAALVEEHLDLELLVTLARQAQQSFAAPWQPPAAAVGRLAVALASGPAFSFHYQENLELLAAWGGELLPFDPLSDERLPQGAQALLFAGGFPELYALALGENVPLREAVRRFVEGGGVAVGECGGLLYLGRELEGQPMCGVLPLQATLSNRLTLGYRQATALSHSPLFRAGEVVRGHEFHYAKATPEADPNHPAWSFHNGRVEGFCRGGIHASFLHLHWAAYPHLPARLLSFISRKGALCT